MSSIDKALKHGAGLNEEPAFIDNATSALDNSAYCHDGKVVCLVEIQKIEGPSSMALPVDYG